MDTWNAWHDYCWFGGDGLFDNSDFCDKDNERRTDLCKEIDGSQIASRRGCALKGTSCVPNIDCKGLKSNECRAQLLCLFDEFTNKCENKKDQDVICQQGIGRGAAGSVDPTSCQNHTAVCSGCQSWCVNPPSTKLIRSHETWLVQNRNMYCDEAQVQVEDECLACGHDIGYGPVVSLHGGCPSICNDDAARDELHAWLMKQPSMNEDSAFLGCAMDALCSSCASHPPLKDCPTEPRTQFQCPKVCNYNDIYDERRELFREMVKSYGLTCEDAYYMLDEACYNLCGWFPKP